MDKLGKIKMTVESLQFIREHYVSYLYAFILNHIDDYIDVVSNDEDSDELNYIFEEVCVLLNKNIDDAQKIQLLKGTDKIISVQGKKYSDELFAYILQNNYDESDLKYLVQNYETFGNQAKVIIFRLSIQEIRTLQQTMLDIASRLLIKEVLSSDDVQLEIRQSIFQDAAPKASDDEIKQWLNLVGLNDFLRLYEERTRPTFEDTKINVAVLEIFKNRNVIVDYELDENNGKYKISRRKQFSLSETD